MPKAVVLLSGGLDSAICLALAKSQGFEVLALTINYGQRHAIEIEKAKRLAKEFNTAKHVIMDIDLYDWKSSSLVSGSSIPKDRNEQEIVSGIPSTYVPARNTVFLSLGLAFAESSNAHDIFIGVNVLDYSGYPDCRPAFIQAFEQLANIATKTGIEGRKIKIHAPLLHMNKAEIIRLGKELKIDFSSTHSCYDPGSDGKPCGRCDSCLLRQKGFREAGMKDPAYK